MAALTAAPSTLALSARQSTVVSRKSSVPASRVCRPQTVCSVQKPVASAEKKRELVLPAGVVAGVGAMMAHPLVAEAGVTPSLKNLLGSVVAGGAVLGAIVLAIGGISSFDPVARGRK